MLLLPEEFPVYPLHRAQTQERPFHLTGRWAEEALIIQRPVLLLQPVPIQLIPEPPTTGHRIIIQTLGQTIRT